MYLSIAARDCRVGDPCVGQGSKYLRCCHPHSSKCDDGWTETLKRVESICKQLVDLFIAVDAIPNRVASDFADVSLVRAVPDLAPNSCVQKSG